METSGPVLLKIRFKIRKDHGKNSYDHHVYQSVDGKSLS